MSGERVTSPWARENTHFWVHPNLDVNVGRGLVLDLGYGWTRLFQPKVIL